MDWSEVLDVVVSYMYDTLSVSSGGSSIRMCAHIENAVRINYNGTYKEHLSSIRIYCEASCSNSFQAFYYGLFRTI